MVGCDSYIIQGDWRSDWPDSFESGKVYKIAFSELEKFLAFACPCGCDRPIWLNISDKNNRPFWDFRDNEGSPDVSPSILRMEPDGCKSHFFMRDGLVRWC